VPPGSFDVGKVSGKSELFDEPGPADRPAEPGDGGHGRLPVALRVDVQGREVVVWL
jgi:hypothetical protein